MNINFDLVVRCPDCGTAVSPDLECPECDTCDVDYDPKYSGEGI